LPWEATASLQPQSYGRDPFGNLSGAGEIAGISFPIVSPGPAWDSPYARRAFAAARGTTRAARRSQENDSTHEKESDMNRDQVNGRAKEVAGKAKKATGKVLGNTTLEVKGALKEAGGKIQKTVGDAREQSKERDRGAE
jgi:uncharacterized protein YjbJ (UPF0337 family)